MRKRKEPVPRYIPEPDRLGQLIHAVLCNPTDRNVLGVLADFLEERGRGDMAAKIRLGGWFVPEQRPAEDDDASGAVWYWCRGSMFWELTTPSEIPYPVYSGLHPDSYYHWPLLAGYTAVDLAYADLAKTALSARPP